MIIIDNKKWYKRLSTCFWFLLATLPVWISVLITLLTRLSHIEGLTSSSDIITLFGNYGFFTVFTSTCSSLSNYCFSPVRNAFLSLFNSLSFTQSTTLSVFCGWFVTVYFIELMVDFVVWLPKFCHNLLERCDK